MSTIAEWLINDPAAQHELWECDAAGEYCAVLATLAPGVSDYAVPGPPATYKVRALSPQAGNPSAFVVPTSS